MRKIALLITLLGITLILFVGNNKVFEHGTIQDIKTSNDKSTILLENTTEKLVTFEKITGLKSGDNIKFTGTKNIYLGEQQLILEKIILIKE